MRAGVVADKISVNTQAGYSGEGPNENAVALLGDNKTVICIMRRDSAASPTHLPLDLLCPLSSNTTLTHVTYVVVGAGGNARLERSSAFRHHATRVVLRHREIDGQGRQLEADARARLHAFVPASSRDAVAIWHGSRLWRAAAAGPLGDAGRRELDGVRYPERA